MSSCSTSFVTCARVFLTMLASSFIIGGITRKNSVVGATEICANLSDYFFFILKKFLSFSLCFPALQEERRYME